MHIKHANNCGLEDVKAQTTSVAIRPTTITNPPPRGTAPIWRVRLLGLSTMSLEIKYEINLPTKNQDKQNVAANNKVTLGLTS